jgi:hypothetical protein
MNAQQRYQEATSHALAGFQLIEAGLKDYIGLYYETVQRVLDGRLCFKYSREEIDDASLERLTNIFSRTSFNEDLIKQLRSLIKERNELAHKALAYLYDEKKTDQEFEAACSKMIRTAETLGELMGVLLKERVLIGKVLRENKSA